MPRATPTEPAMQDTTETRSPLPSFAPSETGEGLFERLRAFLGLRPPVSSLRDDLEEVLEAGAPTSSGFTPEERAMLKNILGLRTLRVGDVAVPRADIVAVPKDIAIGELLKVFANAVHSRLVVYGETLDDPVGMVHIRDLVAFLTNRASATPHDGPGSDEPRPEQRSRFGVSGLDSIEPLSETGLIRHILFVPPSMPAIDLLVKMQATRVHLALVIDEYGGSDGLVSIEDMVEQVVGDIEDEHDDEIGPSITKQPDGSWIADARVGLDEVRDTFGEAFASIEGADDVDTLGGLLVTLAGRVPVRGEILPGPSGYEFEVLDADPRRVKRLRIAR
ncbi:MAG: HlyC/CorC family transporter, partial [Blastochloris sp.]|nr:HlyC/CorC family transporter [Blastochloris sp.]